MMRRIDPPESGGHCLGHAVNPRIGDRTNLCERRCIAEFLHGLADGIEFEIAVVTAVHHLADAGFQRQFTSPRQQPVSAGHRRPNPVGDMHEGRRRRQPRRQGIEVRGIGELPQVDGKPHVGVRDSLHELERLVESRQKTAPCRRQ